MSASVAAPASVDAKGVEGEVFQVAFIPKQRAKQLPDPELESDVMAAFVATCPPLGQVTQVKNGGPVFTAVLEVPEGSASEPWEVALWHDGGVAGGQAGEWSGSSFLRDDGRLLGERGIHECQEGMERVYFILAEPLMVKKGSALSYTVKFRSGEGKPWRWIRDELGLDDGVLIVEGDSEVKESDEEKLPDLIRGFNPELVWRSHMSQCPNTLLWSVQAAVAGAEAAGDGEETSAFADVPLGVPWGKFLR